MEEKAIDAFFHLIYIYPELGVGSISKVLAAQAGEPELRSPTPMKKPDMVVHTNNPSSMEAKMEPSLELPGQLVSLNQ